LSEERGLGSNPSRASEEMHFGQMIAFAFIVFALLYPKNQHENVLKLICVFYINEKTSTL